VDILVVVAAQALLLLAGPGAQRLLDVAVGVLAADHEADLARGVGRDGGVGVLDDGEDLLAGLLQLGDERDVEPLVLSCTWCRRCNGAQQPEPAAFGAGGWLGRVALVKSQNLVHRNTFFGAGGVAGVRG